MNIKEAVQHYESLLGGGIARAAQAAHAELHDACTQRFPVIAMAALREASGAENFAFDEVVFQWVNAMSASLNGMLSTFTINDIPRAPANSMMIVAGGAITADDIEQWVRQGAEIGSDDNVDGKVFDGRDIGSVDDVVRKMQGILLYANPPSESHEKARRKYLQDIAQFKANLEVQAIADWIEKNGAKVVLKAWVQFVTRLWPVVVSKHLAEVL